MLTSFSRSAATATLALALLLTGCATLPAETLRATVAAEGLLDCFAAGLRDADGELAYCEASAAVVDGDQIFIASDKHLPAGTPLLSIKHKNLAPVTGSVSYIQEPLLHSIGKLEGATRTPDGRYLIVTSAFDRIAAASSTLDSFNTLLYWPSGVLQKLRIANPSTRNGVASSLTLRHRLEAHLGVPYFKIEGLMALPGERLVFGIRETGRTYKDFRYRFLLIEARYHIDAAGQLEVDENFRTLLDFDPTSALPHASGLGLSSVEYEPQTQRIYFATSHELSGQMGAYLWQIDLATLDAGGHPTPLTTPEGQPLHLDNKAEGIAILDPSHLFIIHDDDRVTGGKYGRQPHQAVYSVIQVLRNKTTEH